MTRAASVGKGTTLWHINIQELIVRLLNGNDMLNCRTVDLLTPDREEFVLTCNCFEDIFLPHIPRTQNICGKIVIADLLVNEGPSFTNNKTAEESARDPSSLPH